MWVCGSDAKRLVWLFWLLVMLTVSCARYTIPPQTIPLADLHDLTILPNVSDDVLVCAAFPTGAGYRLRCLTVGAFRYWVTMLQQAN